MAHPSLSPANKNEAAPSAREMAEMMTDHALVEAIKDKFRVSRDPYSVRDFIAQLVNEEMNGRPH